MDYVVPWRASLYRDKLSPFLYTIFKGYGEVLICPNFKTGFLLAIAIFFLSWEIFLLTLLGAIASLSAAYLLKARPLHVNSGIYGYNGVILGVAWLWFFKLNLLSITILIIISALSSCMLKPLAAHNSRTKTNLPVFSVPAVILIWGAIIVFHGILHQKNLMGPDVKMLEYYGNYNCGIISLHNKQLTWLTLKLICETFGKHILACMLIFLAIFLHSRISAGIAIISSAVSLGLIYLLNGLSISGFGAMELYLYNSVPCAIALGGAFLVANKRILGVALTGCATCVLLTFVALRYFPLPGFVAPFNLVTILIIGFLKAGKPKREKGIYPVPMDLVYSPESGMDWFRGELFAEQYWKEIQKLCSQNQNKK